MDEYIFCPAQMKLLKILSQSDRDGIRLLKIFQKKFKCRYSDLDKNVIDIHNCIENIDTTNSYKKGCWGEKNIVRMKYLKNINNIHNMSIKRGKALDMNVDILRFNHYNHTDILTKWMQGWYEKEEFEFVLDDSMEEHSKLIDFNQEHSSPSWRKSLLIQNK